MRDMILPLLGLSPMQAFEPALRYIPRRLYLFRCQKPCYEGWDVTVFGKERHSIHL